jgi:hypothetical protein
MKDAAFVKMRATITIPLAHPPKDNRAEVIHALGSSPWKVGDSEVINARFSAPAGNWRGSRGRRRESRIIITNLISR